ncbi:transposase DDE domain protein [Orientia tsutsugamushi str. Gilliam]|uniref:Transposase DDE domain protein n=1 Tax=Orientia tsutsugamushi str. Gilliam TaxID=1359184 RepID=A0A0F3MBC4_ORITS|nr:transposase DDE domain protein [Orientia tsutsugamushi str. Gilliam]
MEYLVRKLKGLLFTDRGFISKKLAVSLTSQDLELIMKTRSNTQEQVIHHIKSLFLSKIRIYRNY